MFKNLILSAVKSALIEKIANEEQRNSLVKLGVSTAVNAIDEKLKLSGRPIAKQLSEKGLDKNFIESTLGTFISTVLGYGAQYATSKLESIDFSKLLESTKSNHLGK